MKFWPLSVCAVLLCGSGGVARAQPLTVVAPGGMRCALDKLAPAFERQSGRHVVVTIGSGGGTHQRVVAGDVFDVPIVQPPYDDVLRSGHVDRRTETPLAVVPLVVVVRAGSPRPDISTADAVKRLLLNAKALSYPDGQRRTRWRGRGELLTRRSRCSASSTRSGPIRASRA